MFILVITDTTPTGGVTVGRNTTVISIVDNEGKLLCSFIITLIQVKILAKSFTLLAVSP